MKDQPTFIEPLLESAEEYGKTSYALFKLKTIDKTADLASAFISRGVAGFFFVLFFFSTNIGISLWLGDVLGESYYGFFCVAGFYAIVGVILYFFMHSYLKKRIGNSIVSQLLQ